MIGWRPFPGSPPSINDLRNGMSVGRLAALVLLTVAAVGIALLLQRRRPDPPSAPSYRAPSQLDRDDFRFADVGVLVVLFASTTCETCPRAWAVMEAVTADLVDRVACQRVDVQHEPELHRRYRIDGVPTTVIADREGVVVQAFFGPVSDAQLRDALALAPGSGTSDSGPGS